MKQKLDIKYNIPNIKAFLSVFNLNLEVYNDLSIKDEIKILDKEKEVGRVLFNEDKIEITSKSIYGDLKTSTDYASAFTLTDVESFDTIGTFGLFASFSNTFKFTLGDKLTGDLNFAIKLDTAVNVKKINNELVDKKYLEFPKKGVDDEEAEVINKGEVFTSISPDTIDKINSLIELFGN